MNKGQKLEILARLSIFSQTKGAEKIISVYWFVILFIVAGTISYSVSIFYGDPYDVREIESNIMINKIADCLSKNGKLDSKINQDNFLEECNLNFGNDEDEYYIEIKIYNFGDEEPSNSIINKGNINLKDNLNIGSIFSLSKSFYVLNEEEEIQGDSGNKKTEELIVKIISIIRKTEKNVK